MFRQDVVMTLLDEGVAAIVPVDTTLSPLEQAATTSRRCAWASCSVVSEARHRVSCTTKSEDCAKTSR
jgi:hypothetical protein